MAVCTRRPTELELKIAPRAQVAVGGAYDDCDVFGAHRQRCQMMATPAFRKMFGGVVQ